MIKLVSFLGSVGQLFSDHECVIVGINTAMAEYQIGESTVTVLFVDDKISMCFITINTATDHAKYCMKAVDEPMDDHITISFIKECFYDAGIEL